LADPTITELAKSVADTQTGLNMVWTVTAGALVMFMQAGFALVETGLTRARIDAHTMGMNFFVHAIGIIGCSFVGFGLQMGGVGPMSTCWARTSASSPSPPSSTRSTATGSGAAAGTRTWAPASASATSTSPAARWCT
jgi:ammonia channel protein AmtB